MMFDRMILVFVWTGLMLFVAMPVQAQPDGVEVKAVERAYMTDPELDWVWGVRIIAEVTNKSSDPVSGLTVYCSMQDSRGKEVLSAQQAVGTVEPNTTKGIPGMSSSRNRGSQDEGLAAFKALKPVLTVR